MRYLAPARAEVSAEVWAHPAFVEIPYRDLLTAEAWPAVASLNQVFGPLQHRRTGAMLQFVEQDAALLQDGCHYEERIFRQARIATRAENWHDLFNALAWAQFPALKSAVNARYVGEFPAGLGVERSRAQMALTHFDEAGLVVHLSDPARLRAWDDHDWLSFFQVNPGSSRWDVRVWLFGHALLEHLLQPHQLLVGKALVVLGGRADTAIARCAAAIERAEVLCDPQELRPLPLSGIPGWHPEQCPSFYRSAPCFRSRRADRIYPCAISGD